MKMKILKGALVAAALVAASIAHSQSGDIPEADLPNPDTIANFTAVLGIPVYFASFPSNLVFHSSSTRQPVFYVYKTLELYGNATVTLETKYHQTRVDEWNTLNQRLDTTLFVFTGGHGQPWGRALAGDRESGDNHFSKLSIELPRGVYRVLVKREFEQQPFPQDYRPTADLQATCTGAGCERPRPESRICLDDDDFACLIGEAITVSGGPDERVSRAVTLTDIPEAARGGVAAAVRTIETREIGGTDYRAHVAGIYAILKSETQDTTIGYAVLGYGSGEPDFNDGMVYGFDLSGRPVYDEYADW